jgi:hypothetical protein
MSQHEHQSTGRPIVIVGVDRSGTSIVSNMVHEWGAYGGDVADLTQQSKWNRYGSWENHEQQSIIGELLDNSGAQYWEPAYTDAVRRRTNERCLREQAERFVASMSHSGRPWFCKEPWLSIQLPFWKEFLDDAVYIITVRNPRESVDSLAPFMLTKDARGVTLTALLLLRWQLFLLSILRDTADTRRKIFVEYERLVTQPQAEAQRLSEFLCRECDIADEGRASRLAAVVHPEEQHLRAAPFQEDAIATAAQKSLYLFLRRKVDDPDLPFDATQFPMYPGYVEYFNNMAWMKAYVIQTRCLMRSYPVRLGLAMNTAVDVLRERYTSLKKFIGAGGWRHREA